MLVEVSDRKSFMNLHHFLFMQPYGPIQDDVLNPLMTYLVSLVVKTGNAEKAGILIEIIPSNWASYISWWSYHVIKSQHTVLIFMKTVLRITFIPDRSCINLYTRVQVVLAPEERLEMAVLDMKTFVAAIVVTYSTYSTMNCTRQYFISDSSFYWIVINYSFWI